MKKMIEPKLIDCPYCKGSGVKEVPDPNKVIITGDIILSGNTVIGCGTCSGHGKITEHHPLYKLIIGNTGTDSSEIFGK